jgi:hypothetical protein
MFPTFEINRFSNEIEVEDFPLIHFGALQGEFSFYFKGVDDSNYEFIKAHLPLTTSPD